MYRKESQEALGETKIFLFCPYITLNGKFPGLGPIGAILVSWGCIPLRILREIIQTQNGTRGETEYMQKLNADLNTALVSPPKQPIWLLSEHVLYKEKAHYVTLSLH